MYNDSLLRWVSLSLLSATYVLSVHSTHASDSPAVQQELSCELMHDATKLRHVLDVELTMLNLRVASLAGESPGRFALSVSTPNESENATDQPFLPIRARLLQDCDAASNRAELSVQLAGAPQPVERPIDLSDVPGEARTRTLAVAVVELIRTTLNAAQAEALRRARAELERQHEKLRSERAKLSRSRGRSQRSLEPQEPRTESPGGTPLKAGAFRLGASGLATLAFDGPGQMFGGEISASLRQSGFWRWSLEASHLRTSPTTSFGRLDVARWGIALGGDWNATTVPALTLGPRASVVALFAQGQSRLNVPEDRQTGLGVSVGGRTSLEVAVTRNLVVRSTLDVGAAVWGTIFTAGGREAFNYEGLQAIWGIGGAWEL